MTFDENTEVHHADRVSGVRRNVKQFRGGLVFKAHTLLYHSTLGWRVIKKKKGVRDVAEVGDESVREKCSVFCFRVSGFRIRGFASRGLGFRNYALNRCRGHVMKVYV